MKRVMIIIALTLVIIIAVCGISYLTDKTTYTSWKLVINSTDKTKISWARFDWGGNTLSGKYYDKAYMQIPCKLEGLPNIFTFQFDLGADMTGVYENSFSSFYLFNQNLGNKIERLKSPIQFWNKNKVFRNYKISFGSYTATNEVGFIYRNYGEQFANPTLVDTFHLGTIGADLFKDKILIIDYPNKRFAICDTIPKEFGINLVDIEVDKSGGVVLPMKFHQQLYRIRFDNGSSLFPIITEVKNISKFSTLPDTDTIQISTWGKMHNVTGKIIKDSFELAGQTFSNVKVYANHSGLGIDKHTDGMTGNALFWNKTIIVDFKNKKFGVK